MKIKVNYIEGQKGSSVFGVNRISVEMISKLRKVVEYKKITYRLFLENSFLRQFFIYFWYPVRLALRLLNSVEIIHISNQGYAHIAHFLPKNKLIITCCDLIPLISPQNNNFWQNKLLKFSFSGLKKAKKIIAISQSTKTNLINLLNIPEEKIVVVYPGIDEKFRELDKRKVLKLKKSLFPGRKIILYVGSYLPNKNLPTVLRVFQKIRKKINNLILVIVNEKNKLPSEDKALIDNLNIENDIYFTGYISDQKLVELYNMADVFLFPSLYEGFGFPVIEAMACGCPVITSDTSSLPELVGDGGIMVDFNNYKKIAKKAIQLLKNREISDTMINKGLKQVEKFRDNPSEKVLDIYRELV